MDLDDIPPVFIPFLNQAEIAEYGGSLESAPQYIRSMQNLTFPGTSFDILSSKEYSFSLEELTEKNMQTLELTLSLLKESYGYFKENPDPLIYSDDIRLSWDAGSFRLMWRLNPQAGKNFDIFLSYDENFDVVGTSEQNQEYHDFLFGTVVPRMSTYLNAESDFLFTPEERNQYIQFAQMRLSKDIKDRDPRPSEVGGNASSGFWMDGGRFINTPPEFIDDMANLITQMKWTPGLNFYGAKNFSRDQYLDYVKNDLTAYFKTYPKMLIHIHYANYADGTLGKNFVRLSSEWWAGDVDSAFNTKFLLDSTLIRRLDKTTLQFMTSLYIWPYTIPHEAVKDTYIVTTNPDGKPFKVQYPTVDLIFPPNN